MLNIKVFIEIGLEQTEDIFPLIQPFSKEYF